MLLTSLSKQLVRIFNHPNTVNIAPRATKIYLFVGAFAFVTTVHTHLTKGIDASGL